MTNRSPASSGDHAVLQVLKKAAARGEITGEALVRATARLGGRRSRPEAHSRRGDILAAATRIFGLRGYHTATLQDIAKEIGLTRAAFYYYFSSKQEILEAVCRESVDAADAVIDAALAAQAEPGAAAVRDTLNRYARHIANAETTAIMMRNFEEMSLEERRRLTARRRRRQEKVQVLVEEAVARGELDLAEPKIAVLTMFEAIHSMHNWLHRDGRLSRGAVAETIVAQLLDGAVSRLGGAASGRPIPSDRRARPRS